MVEKRFSLIFSLVILTAAVVFLIWFFFFRETKTIPEGFFAVNESENFSLYNARIPEYELSPEIKIKEPLFFVPEQVAEGIKKFVPIGELAGELKEGLVKKEETKESAAQGSRLTDEEYFSLFYSEDYFKYLNFIQDWLIGERYIKEEEKIAIKTEKDSYLVLTRGVDYMADQGYFTEEEREILKRGINIELYNLNKEERLMVEKILLGSVLKEILKKLAMVLAPKACAFAEVDSGAECYRMGAGAPGVGFNAGAMCCNCGFTCGTSGCWFVPNCGPAGGICNLGWHLGCLNAVCPGRPAIWDPMTGICGCSL